MCKIAESVISDIRTIAVVFFVVVAVIVFAQGREIDFYLNIHTIHTPVSAQIILM